MALLGAAWIPMWFFLNLYLQQVLGYGAFESGAALLPMTVAIMLLMVGVTGRLIARYGFKPPMVVGLALLAVGISLLARVPVDGGFATDILGASLVAAGGMSLAYIPVLIASISNVQPEQSGLASGLVNTSYRSDPRSASRRSPLSPPRSRTNQPEAVSLTPTKQRSIGAAVIAAAAALVAAALIRRPSSARAHTDAEVLEPDLAA